MHILRESGLVRTLVIRDSGPYLSKSSGRDDWNIPSKVVNAAGKIPTSCYRRQEIHLHDTTASVYSHCQPPDPPGHSLTLHKTIEARYCDYLYFPGRLGRYRTTKNLTQSSELGVLTLERLSSYLFPNRETGTKASRASFGQDLLRFPSFPLPLPRAPFPSPLGPDTDRAVSLQHEMLPNVGPKSKVQKFWGD